MRHRQYEQIVVEQIDAVLRITLNRPDRLNAWTPTMMAELVTAVKAANDDPSIGAIVVTGAGRGFCAGADIQAVFERELDDGPARPIRPAEERPDDWVRLCRESKPLVAAINGAAVGVGLTLVLPFDQLVAAEGAKLSARFVKLGLVPELASSHWLVTRCGFGAASWLALSGATVIAEEARELGLVDRVTAPDELLDEAMALAGQLAENPPTQLRLIKQLLTANAAETDLDAVQRRELEAMRRATARPSTPRRCGRSSRSASPCSGRELRLTAGRGRRRRLVDGLAARRAPRAQLDRRAAAIVVGNARQDALDAAPPTTRARPGRRRARGRRRSARRRDVRAGSSTGCRRRVVRAPAGATRGQDVRGDAGERVAELTEATRPVEEGLDDEQRPAVADPGQRPVERGRLGDRSVAAAWYSHLQIASH